MTNNGANPNNPSKNNNSSDDGQVREEEEEEDQFYCGLGTWRPPWMQKLASPKVFMFNFSLIAVIQGSYHVDNCSLILHSTCVNIGHFRSFLFVSHLSIGSYFSYLIGTASTLEKRFAYSSQLTGFILIADNFSQILISPLIGFLGKHMNKATLIAGGMVFVSFSCWLTALPYFLYGPGVHLLHRESHGLSNSTNAKFDYCAAGSGKECENDDSSTVWTAFMIIWVASFLNGVGYTAFSTLGFPYVDDNVSKKNAPLYFSRWPLDFRYCYHEK